MAESRLANPLITLPGQDWSPRVNPTPGRISIIGSGKLDSESSYFSEEYLSKMKEADCDIAVAGSSVSTSNFSRSLINGLLAGVKIMARYGSHTSLKLTGFPTTSPTVAQMEQLEKIVPTNSIWESSYSHWDDLTQFLATPQLRDVNGKSVDIRTALAGCMIVDKPYATCIWGTSRYAHLIWDRLNGKLPGEQTPFIYVNLLPDLISGTAANGTTPVYNADVLAKYSGGMNDALDWLGGFDSIESYEDYVDLACEKYDLSLMSFDSYPLRAFNGNKTELKSQMIQFFSSLIFYQNRRKVHNIDFWTHVFCAGLERKSSNGIVEESTGEPSKGRLRFAALISLLYGARGIVYWPFAAPGGLMDGKYTCIGAPVDATGEKTETHTLVRDLNRQIRAIEPILMSARIAMTAVTSVPPHVDKMTEIPGILSTTVNFGAFNKIESNGAGVVMSHLYNSAFDYFAFVNMDYNNTQGVNLTLHDGKVGELIYNGKSQLEAVPVEIETSQSLSFPPGDIKIIRFKK